MQFYIQGLKPSYLKSELMLNSEFAILPSSCTDDPRQRRFHDIEVHSGCAGNCGTTADEWER
jgi:hypothetical protein